MKVKDYQLVFDSVPARLEKKVNTLLAQGYELLGELSANEACTEYRQVCVRLATPDMELAREARLRAEARRLADDGLPEGV